MLRDKGTIRAVGLSRRRLVGGSLAAAMGLDWDDPLPQGITPAPLAERRVGLGYSLWHESLPWKKVWGTPSRGFYRSDDRSVIRAHAAELSDAGVDFLLLDTTNDIGSDVRTGVGLPYQRFEEHVVATLFDEYATLRSPPKLSFALGYVPNSDDLFNGRLMAKADEIYAVYVRNPRYSCLLQTYRSLPLLIIYGETPARFQYGLPPWSDPRFTVRFMTAGLTEQPQLLGSAREHCEKVSKYGYWSWQDRGASSYPIVDRHPEAMMITAFWPDDEPNHRRGQGRMNGATYRAAWQRARRLGPRFVMAGTFNEWIVSEQPSAEMSKDVEPSVEHGREYLDILREESRLFHAGR